MNTYIIHWYWYEDNEATHSLLKAIAETEDEALLKVLKHILDDDDEYSETLEEYVDENYTPADILWAKGISANIELLDDMKEV